MLLLCVLLCLILVFDKCRDLCYCVVSLLFFFLCLVFWCCHGNVSANDLSVSLVLILVLVLLIVLVMSRDIVIVVVHDYVDALESVLCFIYCVFDCVMVPDFAICLAISYVSFFLFVCFVLFCRVCVCYCVVFIMVVCCRAWVVFFVFLIVVVPHYSFSVVIVIAIVFLSVCVVL